MANIEIIFYGFPIFIMIAGLCLAAFRWVFKAERGMTLEQIHELRRKRIWIVFDWLLFGVGLLCVLVVLIYKFCL